MEPEPKYNIYTRVNKEVKKALEKIKKSQKLNQNDAVSLSIIKFAKELK